MTGNKLTYSSELIQNFLQAEIMSPEGKFQALQTDTGLGLVFSLSRAGCLNLVQEQTGTASGWQFKDLSSALIKKDFPGRTDVKVKTFAVAQCALVQLAAKGTAIRVAMVLSDTKRDYLYLSLDNSASDLSWTDNPKWTSYPFDNPKKKCDALKVVGVWLSNAVDAAHIMVDIARTPASTPELVDRYYIDPHKVKESYAWIDRSLPNDLECDAYQSCSGRQAGPDGVEGHYTAGELMGSAQFIFMPFFNPYDHDVPPSPTRLQLPGKLKPKAIASCRNPADNTTDLYVAAKGGLYYFASDKQLNDAEGELILSSPLFNDVHDLFAGTDGTQIIVWGRNGSNEAFYTTSQYGSQASPRGWSLPLPILSKVSLISPYINRGNSANVFYASDGKNLFRMTKSVSTTLWTQQSITLPPNDKTPALSFSSYTTRLQLTDDSSKAQSKKTLHLSASSRGGFFINGLYYVLDNEPVSIETDTVGSITIIEAANGINGTTLTVYDDSENTLTIDPTEKPMKKVFELNSENSLRQAKIVSSDGSSVPLVKETSSDNLTVAAAMIDGLRTTKTDLFAHAGANALPLADGALAADLGDIISWLKSGIDRVTQIVRDGWKYVVSIGDRVLEFVKDAATGIWKFVLKIGEKIYNAVLDCMEKIVAAAEWVFDAIKAAIDEVVKFLSYIFDWNAITRTQKVLKNLIHVWVKDQAAGIGKVQKEIDKTLDTIIAQLDTFAGISDWSALGDIASKSLSSMSISMDGQNVTSNFLSYHLTNNQESVDKSAPPPVSSSEQLVLDLIDALKSEEAVLEKTIEQFGDLVSQASSLTFGQLLTKILAILSSGVLSSCKVVIHALLDVLKDVINLILEWLEKPITIPVLSDILSSFGVPSISILDLVCWVAAVPVTIGYKVTHGQAPFADDDTTKILTGESAHEAAKAVSFAANDSGTGKVKKSSLEVMRDKVPEDTREVLFHVLQTAVSIIVPIRAFTAAADVFLDEPNDFVSSGDAALSVVGEIVAIVCEEVFADYPEISNECETYNCSFKFISILVGALFSAVDFTQGINEKCETLKACKKEAKGTGSKKGYYIRIVESFVELVVALPCFGGSVWRICDLAKKPAEPGYATAMIDVSADILGDVACFSHFLAATCRWDAGSSGIGIVVTVGKAVSIVVMETSYFGVAGLHLLELVGDEIKKTA